eukprot:7386474-Prymnesium_polylepis.3
MRRPAVGGRSPLHVRPPPSGNRSLPVPTDARLLAGPESPGPAPGLVGLHALRSPGGDIVLKREKHEGRGANRALTF